METLHNTYDAMERLLTPKGRFFWYAYDALTYIGAVSKHAESMSLRCDVICALAYCGRHESSHIIKAHTDSTRRLFVEICVNSRLKNLCKKNCVNNEICGFKASHKFSRIICGLNGVFLNDFTYLCLYAFQKPFVS